MKHLARVGSMIRRAAKWVLAIILGTFASFIPVVGLLGAKGYALERARCAAWRIDPASLQR